MSSLRQRLRDGRYDIVLDLQGLLKSAIWARQSGSPVAGYDRRSSRDPASAWLYRSRFAVSLKEQAVQRCRELAALGLGYPVPTTAPNFGLVPPASKWRPRQRYAILIPNASRKEKLWPERHWVSIGLHLKDKGLLPLVLWGTNEEQTLAERIAAGCDGDVPPYLKVGEMAGVLAGAEVVVGLDTGFSHLAAALGRPTLGIYCDHDPGLAGITGPGPVRSIGGKGVVPSRNEVLALLVELCAPPMPGARR